MSRFTTALNQLCAHPDLGDRMDDDHCLYAEKLFRGNMAGKVGDQARLICLEADAGFGKKLLNIFAMAAACLETDTRCLYAHPTKANRDETFSGEEEKKIEHLFSILENVYGVRPTQSRLQSPRGFLDPILVEELAQHKDAQLAAIGVIAQGLLTQWDFVEIGDLAVACRAENLVIPAGFVFSSLEDHDRETITKTINNDVAKSATVIHVTQQWICHRIIYEAQTSSEKMFGVKALDRLLIDEAHLIPHVSAAVMTGTLDFKLFGRYIKGLVGDPSTKALILKSIRAIRGYTNDMGAEIKSSGGRNPVITLGSINQFGNGGNFFNNLDGHFIDLISNLAILRQSLKDNGDINEVEDKIAFIQAMKNIVETADTRHYATDIRSTVKWPNGEAIFAIQASNPGRMLAPMYRYDPTRNRQPITHVISLTSATLDVPGQPVGDITFRDLRNRMQMGGNDGVSVVYDVENSGKFRISRQGNLSFVVAPGGPTGFPVPVLPRKTDIASVSADDFDYEGDSLDSINPTWVTAVEKILMRVAQDTTGGTYLYCNSNADKMRFAEILKDHPCLLVHHTGMRFPAREWDEAVESGFKPVLLSCITEGVNLQGMTQIIVSRLPIARTADQWEALSAAQRATNDHKKAAWTTHNGFAILLGDSMRKLYQLICRLNRSMDSSGRVVFLDSRFMPKNSHSRILPSNAFFSKFEKAVPDRFALEVRRAKALTLDGSIIPLKEWK